ncbi:MAG TPA: quinone-dependent dihydroorotate dehydrogenase [Myxococcaceae bacterium]|nr:quinone-dependent dihydroorotate dehydrogenase [Myxococcaceae bacterium]
MYGLIKRGLFLLPPERAHALGMVALRLWGAVRPPAVPSGGPDLSVTSAGLRFAHPVVLAAGFDKDAEAVAGFFGVGFAGVEVGTVTPLPQPGNPPPRLFRIPEARALINRMGFNNHGAEAMAARLRALGRRPGPVGVNLGKNKDTPLERAVDDYVAGAEALGVLADYLVINASSPNTPGLRQLQQSEPLRALLPAVKARVDVISPGTPLFLKIAPDLAREEVDAVVDVAVEVGLAGLICTNTTLARPGVTGPVAAEAGGLSGAPLAPLALGTLRRAAARARGRLALWASGGVFTADDVLERLDAGADLVQVYTAFVYQGPFLVPNLLSDLRARLIARGLDSLPRARGASAGAEPRSRSG